MEKLKLGDCTVRWDNKSVARVGDGIVRFKDGDYFNSNTGDGLHRYGTLVVVGKCQMADEAGNLVTTTRHGVYEETYQPK